MFRVIASFALLVTLASLAPPVQAQPITKQPIQVEAGSTKLTGDTFGYRLTYNCSSTSGPCLNAEIVDLLPPEVQLVSTAPSTPTDDVAAILVTPNFQGQGRTRVGFQMITPLPAGNSGDLIINVRFPNGSTPDGTVATNTVDGINLQTTPGTFTTPPVTVTAVAAPNASLEHILTTAPANLDMPETYRLRISNSNASGTLNLTSIGPVIETLPPGTVFYGATPAAECQPDCIGKAPATIEWTSPCTVPLVPNANCDILVNIVFPSATFLSGTNVSPSFSATATPLGESSQSLGTGTNSHPVTTFVPENNIRFELDVAENSPNPPTLNQAFAYEMTLGSFGNVPLNNMVVIDTLPVEMHVSSITTGAYTNLSDFAAGEGVRVSYEKNTAPGVFTLWGSSPNTGTNTTLTAPPPGLGAGEYISRIRWEFGQAHPGMTATTRPLIRGQIINPSNLGGPVSIGKIIENCIDMTATSSVSPPSVTNESCVSFAVAAPFVMLSPTKVNLSGEGSFNPGQNVSFRLNVRSDARSSSPLPLANVVVTDLLPENLLFSTWTYDDQGTALPAPQVFEQIPNFANTGRTLLRWRWNGGSGNLGVGQHVRIMIGTTVRSGATAGSLENSYSLHHDNSALHQRCSDGALTDSLDLDGDGDTLEELCQGSVFITVSSIAQLAATKRVARVCGEDVSSIDASAPNGCPIEYAVTFENIGTVPLTNLTVIDILPFVGDTNVRNSDSRGSSWGVTLTGPVTAPPGATVYYSTSGNPCRGEVGGPTTGCDPANWTTTMPAPISSVRSIKFAFDDHILQPFTRLTGSLEVTTSSSAALGTFAYNSMAYTVDRTDGLGTLAGEPSKVSLEASISSGAGIGDFVWEDLNGDGLQNDGPTGLNDIRIRLYTAGSDAVPHTPDDVLLATTRTTQSPTGEPGWYMFSNLSIGTYYVCVETPPHATISPQGTGSPDDSDVNATSGCSDAIQLASTDQIADVDIGLVTTGQARITGHTWIDRNADGLQNESFLDGLNGVTVELYADDGNNAPEIGIDLLVTQTITVDDSDGRPGFYQFNNLDPTGTYFVRFVLPAVATAFTTANAGNETMDSDAATASGLSPTLPLTPGSAHIVDAGFLVSSGDLSLGDQVWLDIDNDGFYEPHNGETGINGVRLDLYASTDADGLPVPDTYRGSTLSTTEGGNAGRYHFTDLPAGNYIVVIPDLNFANGGPLAGLLPSLGGVGISDPDDNINGDSNGTYIGPVILSNPITLTSNSNLTLDFGFTADPNLSPPRFDFGDAPDAGIGTGKDNYQTTFADGGPYHAIVPAGPYLGACVDSDNGQTQNALANADDLTIGNSLGTCLNGDDEDGVVIPTSNIAGMPTAFHVNIGSTIGCYLNAWLDLNQNGVFGDTAAEIITSSQWLDGGSNTTLNLSIPADAPGTTYARFRCSTTSVLSPTGPASDGEVEDYRVTIDSDNTPPQLHLPANIVVVPTGTNGKIVDYIVTATDDTDPNPVIVCIPASGTRFSIGTTTVDCTATDIFTNQSSGSFTVTVQSISDLFAALRQQINDTATTNSVKQHLLFRVLLADIMNRIGIRSLTCTSTYLIDFQVRTLTRLGRIPTPDATALHTRTSDLRTALGCRTN